MPIRSARPETVLKLLRARYPGLLRRIQRHIESAERTFAGNAPETDGSFLWEHTVHVASLAYALAGEEKRDPGLAALTALFHDAGKFSGGRYHEGEEPEEEEAARLAAAWLKTARVPPADRAAVVDALKALYRQGAARQPLADIVHDADFLSKFGTLGVAQFFVKSTLRGKTLRQTASASLSKELTYAAGLPLAMRTSAGQGRAGRKAEDTLRFYGAFLRELGEAHGLEFAVRALRLPHPRRPGRTVDVRLVLTPACEECGGAWTIKTETVPGAKCDRLRALVRCRRCGAGQEISFCLPELGS